MCQVRGPGNAVPSRRVTTRRSRSPIHTPSLPADVVLPRGLAPAESDGFQVVLTNDLIDSLAQAVEPHELARVGALHERHDVAVRRRTAGIRDTGGSDTARRPSESSGSMAATQQHLLLR